jgi:hypothetical protein
MAHHFIVQQRFQLAQQPRRAAALGDNNSSGVVSLMFRQ